MFHVEELDGIEQGDDDNDDDDYDDELSRDRVYEYTKSLRRWRTSYVQLLSHIAAAFTSLYANEDGARCDYVSYGPRDNEPSS